MLSKRLKTKLLLHLVGIPHPRGMFPLSNAFTTSCYIRIMQSWLKELLFLLYRLNLSSDALEEFLSILRPSLLSPSTPGIRARRNESVSSLLPIERPQTTRFHDGIRNKSPSFSSIASAADDENGLSLVTGSSPRSDSCSDMDTNEQLICNLWRIPGVLG